LRWIGAGGGLAAHAAEALVREAYAESRLVQQREGNQVHRAETGENEAGKPPLDLLKHHAEGCAAGLAKLLQRLGKFTRHRQHIAHELLALALRDDEVLLERIEVTQ